MQDLEIANSPLKNINPTDYTISIRPRPGGFCFVLYNRATRKFAVLYDATTNSTEGLLALWKKLGIEGERFHSISIVDDCEKWTLLPKEMRDADLEAVWQLNFGQPPAQPLHDAELNAVGARCIFEASDKSVKLKETFGNATLFPLPAADIAYAVQTNQQTQGHYLGLDIRDKQLNLFLLEKGRLLLANSFGTDTTTDVLYYAMNMVRTFNLDQKETVAEVWGKNANETAALLKNYLQHANVAGLNNHFDYENGIKKLPNKHEYYDLFNIATCAL